MIGKNLIDLKDIDGKDTSLKAYAGKVVLVVNVAYSVWLFIPIMLPTAIFM